MIDTLLHTAFWAVSLFLALAAFLPLRKRAGIMTDTLAHFTLQWAIGAILTMIAGIILRVGGGFYALLLVSYFVCLWRMLPYLHKSKANGRKDADTDTASRLKILQCNTLYLNRKTRKLRTDFSKLMDLIHHAQPDVIFLTEVNTPLATRLAVMADYQHRHVHVKDHCGFGMALLSRIPFDRVEEKYQACPYIPSIHAQITVAGKDVHLLSIHAENPFHQVRERHAGMSLKRLWRYIRNNLRHRDMEMDKIAQWVKTARPARAIIAGDFNCTPYAPAFRAMRRASGLTDARTGRGLMGTYPQWTQSPALRLPIDHLFTTQGAEVESFQCGPHVDSDHFPLISEIKIL